jgi:hypothetical protein
LGERFLALGYLHPKDKDPYKITPLFRAAAFFEIKMPRLSFSIFANKSIQLDFARIMLRGNHLEFIEGV